MIKAATIYRTPIVLLSDAVRKIIAEDSTIEAALMDISLRGKEDGLQITRFLRKPGSIPRDSAPTGIS